MLKQEALQCLSKSISHATKRLDTFSLQLKKDHISYLHYHYVEVENHINQSVAIELPPLEFKGDVPKPLKDYGIADVETLGQKFMSETNVTLQKFNKILFKCVINVATSTDSSIESVNCYICTFPVRGTNIRGIIPISESSEENDILSIYTCYLTPEGNIAPAMYSRFENSIVNDTIQHAFAKQYPLHHISKMILMWANCLLNCKNVSLVEIEPKPLTKKQKKRKLKKRESHHVIHVNNDRKVIPPTKVSWEDRNIVAMSSVDVKMGHFKTYTKERPLLGKHVGTWWWSPILKNNAENKVTYKVEENV